MLDAMISSHIDADHYGGLGDLLDTAQEQQLDCERVTIEHFFHSGLSQWKNTATTRAGLGPYVSEGGRKWFTRLLGDRASAGAAISGAGPKASGWWGGFIDKLVNKSDTAAGTPTPISRVSQKTQWLPGFGLGSSVAIRVLGPIEGGSAGQPTLLRLASEKSQNTNGTSVLLRVDYGATCTLLTGDLNANAHRALLAEYQGQEGEFSSDVAKSCHHGAEDVSFPFLNYIKAACTVISSRDDEGHDHPRPRVVAASGLSGYATFQGDELLTPLVYSTELARSIQVGTLCEVKASAKTYAKADLPGLTAQYEYVSPGALRPTKASKKMSDAKVMHRLVYGLVNVRTDGERIVAATMNEGDGSFTTKAFKSRFQSSSRGIFDHHARADPLGVSTAQGELVGDGGRVLRGGRVPRVEGCTHRHGLRTRGPAGALAGCPRSGRRWRGRARRRRPAGGRTRTSSELRAVTWLLPIWRRHDKGRVCGSQYNRKGCVFVPPQGA